MKREDILKMTTEELCALTTVSQIAEYQDARDRTVDDAEFNAFLAERLDHLSMPYVKEINEGFECGRRDLSEMVERYNREAPLVKLRIWTQSTQLGVEHIELAKYVHRYLARSILAIFAMKIPDENLGVIPTTPSVFKKPE